MAMKTEKRKGVQTIDRSSQRLWIKIKIKSNKAQKHRKPYWKKYISGCSFTYNNYKHR